MCLSFIARQQVRNITAVSYSPQSGRTNSWFLWFVLLFSTAIFHISSADSQVINRVNYGVVFTKQTTVGVVYDYWTHTVQINIPDIEAPHRRRSTCFHHIKGQINHLCLPLQHMYRSVDNVRNEFFKTLNASFAEFMTMMPTSPSQKSRSKSRRAPLSFVGDISKSIFGTARVKDVKLLARHIEALEDKTTTTLTKLAQFTDDMSSFIAISDKRYANLKTTIMGMEWQNVEITQAMERLEKSIRERNMLTNNMTILFVEELYHSLALQAGFSDFLDGIHDLMRHKLSPHIIPHNDLLHIVERINTKLHTKDIPLEVLPMDTPDMYNFYPFYWTYRDSGIYITIKFPLVLSSMGKFDVYKIITFNVPMNNDSFHHATALVNVPELLGFSHNNQYYAFPTRDMINGPILDAQTANLPLHPLHHSSCITAIFFDEKQVIKDLCDFRVTLNSIRPSVIHLHQGQYLVLNVTTMYQKCPSGIHKISGCPFCIYSVPCFCDLETDEVYYPPRLTHCVRANETAPLEHSINLAMLLHIYELDEIRHLSAESKFQEQPLVSTPPLKVFKHNFSDLIAQDKQDDLSLKRIAESLRNDKVIFQTLADPILDDLNDVYEDVSLISWNSILTIVNAALLLIVFAALAFLYYRFRILTMALTLLQQSQRVQSQDILNLNPEPGIQIIPTSPPAVTSLPIYITIHDETMLYLLITLACLIICFLIYHIMTRKFSLAYVSMEITSGRSCVMIPLIAIPYCPKFLHCEIMDTFTNIQIHGIIRPQLSWHIDTLNITNTINKQEITVPRTLSVSILQGIKLRKLLRKTFYCHLIAQHANQVFHIRMCPPGCQQCLPPVPVPVREAPANDNRPMIPLYPILHGPEEQMNIPC